MLKNSEQLCRAESMDVKLRIRVTQRDLGEEHVSDRIFSARLVPKNGRYYLTYAEPDPEGGEIRCMLHAGDHTLDIIRRGAQESHMTLKLGQRTAEMRDTPAGPMLVETETKAYCLERGEGFLRIDTEYDLFLEGKFISVCSALIEAVSEDEDAGRGEGK